MQDLRAANARMKFNESSCMRGDGLPLLVKPRGGARDLAGGRRRRNNDMRLGVYQARVWVACFFLGVIFGGSTAWADITTARPVVRGTAAIDRLDVAELSSRYSWAVDSGVNREMLGDVFTPDAVAEYVFRDETGMVVIDAHLNGINAIYEWLHSNQYRPLGSVNRPIPHHFITSPIVELDGDAAELRCYLHGWPGDFVGFYRMRAVRTVKGWRIGFLRLESMTRVAEN